MPKPRLILALAASLAAALALALTATPAGATPASPPAVNTLAIHARTATPPPPCAAGTVQITDDPAGGWAIVGNGLNNQVSLSTTGGGNCFTREFSGTVNINGTGYTWYEYQNGSGYCIWDNGSHIELGAACLNNHPNEELFGEYYVPDTGWEMHFNNGNEGLLMNADESDCGAGSLVYDQDADACGLWNFPS